MKIELYEGCFEETFLIDGEDLHEMSLDDKKDVVIYLFDKLVEGHEAHYHIDNIIRDIVTDYGEIVNEHQCEQCGSYNIDYKLEI